MGALTIALLLTLGTAIMTSAISVGAYPSSPVTRTHFPTGPVRDVPKATSGNNTCLYGLAKQLRGALKRILLQRH